MEKLLGNVSKCNPVPFGQGERLAAEVLSESNPVPYRGNIAVVASLSGGRVLAGLARALQDFMKEAAVEPLPSLEAIHHVMHGQGIKKKSTDLKANANLSGERYDPLFRGSLTNLSFDNLSIGDITAALCRGLVTSLKDSLPEQLLVGRCEVVGSGNAISRSPLMQQIIQQSCGCALKLQEGAEATACGAAPLAASKK